MKRWNSWVRCHANHASAIGTALSANRANPRVIELPDMALGPSKLATKATTPCIRRGAPMAAKHTDAKNNK